MITMFVGLYARVSTKDKHQTVDSQLTTMRKYCYEHGWKFREYFDKVSGKLESEKNRQGLERMIADMKSGQLDGVLILNEERFARSVELGTRLIREVRESNKFIDIVEKNLHITKENWSPSMLWSTTIGFTQGESGNMQHAMDVKRGIQRKREKDEVRGIKWQWGKGRKPLQVKVGVDAEGNNVYKSIDIERVITLHKENVSLRNIAQDQGCSTTPIIKIIEKMEEIQDIKSQ